MFVYLLFTAVEKHAQLKKVFLTKKIPKVLKETWFDQDCKSLLAKRQLACASYSQNASADNWSAFSRSRLKLTNVTKDKQKSSSRKYFSSHGSAKDRWIFLNASEGEISIQLISQQYKTRLGS